MDSTNFDETWSDLHELLHNDITGEDEFPQTSPLLTHYTSLVNLESILSNNQLWLSNPLYMNDMEEVRFGVHSGMEIIDKNLMLREALKTDERRQAFFGSLKAVYEEYANEHVIDLYVTCFSLQDPSEYDGKLSMWRGYGQNGRGAAIVFDTSKINALDESPLALGPVRYGSQDERRNAISDKITEVAHFISKSVIPDEHLGNVARAVFSRLCLFAIFTKHSGFREEAEWRLVYLKERDRPNLLQPHLSYFNGPNGIEPKLKLPIKPIKGAIDEALNLTELIDRILIGPTASSPLAKRSVERMLEQIGKPELKPKIWMSGIPYRGGV